VSIVRFIRLSFLTSSILGSLIAQPTVFNGGVINGASYIPAQAVAPGSLVAIYGSNLSTQTVSGDTVPLSNQINGTSVTINGITAPLLFVSNGQINAQLPWELLNPDATTGTANIVVTSGTTSSVPVTVQLAQIAPGIYSIPSGIGYAVAINNADSSLAAPVGAIPGVFSHPANVGDAIILYANGLGPLLQPDMDGAASGDMTRYAASVPSLLLGGVQANVFFAGLTPQFPGVNQINFFVPQVPAGNSIPLQLQAGGITSTDQVVMAVN
jgi:uncharacterized protein (TIGR03437 family)